jgi:phospholipid/cholesterol/gamma-HCH transport system ATP-binding protein
VGALVEVKGVVNSFGDQIVHDGIDLELEEGEILGLVGGSGSGKSVLLRTILGLHKPDKGRVLVEGHDVTKLTDEERKEMAKKWGVLFQDAALFSGLTVIQNVALPLCEHTALPEKDIEALASFKLEMVGLKGNDLQKLPAELSGGMARRAGLARALALDPEILFLDEPTSGLDPVNAAAVDTLILELKKVLALSVLLITHDLDSLMTICDRVAMIVDKRIVTGTIADMMASEHPQIREFFRGPRMRAVIERPKAGQRV